ncbi:MAG: hypothetical protein Ct9H300mP11_25550 [Chloroflexota bacterium]|nr:MAG: hypothetical protein Ct9H300mP11_25550 [Chloroflexota bacterium]
MGRPLLTAEARDYFGLKPQLWEAVHTSLDSLREDFDIVVVEGAGSPAEINLKKNEIVNMRVALYAKRQSYFVVISTAAVCLPL